jgi:hypothetical protein
MAGHRVTCQAQQRMEERHGRNAIWDHYTKRQKSYASDLRQSGANGEKRVSRYLPASRIEGQKEDENGFFAKARQR